MEKMTQKVLNIFGPGTLGGKLRGAIDATRAVLACHVILFRVRGNAAEKNGKNRHFLGGPPNDRVRESYEKSTETFAPHRIWEIPMRIS